MQVNMFLITLPICAYKLSYNNHSNWIQRKVYSLQIHKHAIFQSMCESVHIVLKHISKREKFWHSLCVWSGFYYLLNELTRYAFVFPPGKCAMTSKVFRFNFNRVGERKRKNATELDNSKKKASCEHSCGHK